MQTRPPPPSEVVKFFLWKMRNVLNRMKNEMKKISDCYFSSYGWKFIENWGDFEYKNDHNQRGFKYRDGDKEDFIQNIAL